MITEAILNFLFYLPYSILQAVSVADVTISIENNTFEIIKDLTCGVAYVVPVARLMPIFLTRIGLMIFKVSWAIIIRVKSFIPTMGN